MFSLWNLKHRAKTLHFLLSNAMFCTMFFLKTLSPYVFDDVLQKAKHRTNNASNGVNRPPLLAVSLYYLMTTQI